MQPTPYFIGLDIGTTSTKAIAFDERGNTLVSTVVAYPTFYPVPNQAVQKAETIWDAVQASVKRVLDTVSAGYVLEAVGFSSAMHTLLPIDEAGNPLSDVSIWSDNRAEDVVNKILDEEGDLFYTTAGVPLHPMTPFAKLLWAVENDIDWWKNANRFLGIKEWIWLKLTGHFEMDYSIAGATGMFDVHQNIWNEKAIERAKIRTSQLPQLVDTLTVRLCVSDDLFPKGTKLVIGASDGCLANLGADAIKTGTIAVTVGTSSAARVIVSKPVVDPTRSTFCFYLAPRQYVVGGGSNSGGIVAEWFVKNFADNNFGTFFEWIDSVQPGADGLIFLPYLQGERAPVWNSSAQGMFFGLRMQHSRRHMARAVIEGIILNIKQIIDTIGDFQKQDFEAVKVGGGSASSPIVLQLLADILNLKVHVTQTNEHSAWGAVLMAMRAVGKINNFDQLSQQPPMVILAPRINDKNLYINKLNQFKKLYNQTQNLCK